jgi:hypothetical protein
MFTRLEKKYAQRLIGRFSRLTAWGGGSGWIRQEKKVTTSYGIVNKS